MKFRKHFGKAESLTENMFACLLVFDSEAEEDKEVRDWIREKKVTMRHFQHKTKDGVHLSQSDLVRWKVISSKGGNELLRQISWG